jgi:hypothetical protein
MTCFSCQWPSAPFTCRVCECHFCESCFDGSHCLLCTAVVGELTDADD